MGIVWVYVCNVITLIHRIVCVVFTVHCTVVRYNGIVDGKSLVLSVTVSQ